MKTFSWFNSFIKNSKIAKKVHKTFLSYGKNREHNLYKEESLKKY